MINTGTKWQKSYFGGGQSKQEIMIV
jgi:hypothetical protein